MSFYKISIVLFFILQLLIKKEFALCLIIGSFLIIIFKLGRKELALIFIVVLLLPLSYPNDIEKDKVISGTVLKDNPFSKQAVLITEEKNKVALFGNNVKQVKNGQEIELINNIKEFEKTDIKELFSISEYYLSKHIRFYQYLNEFEIVKNKSKKNLRDNILEFAHSKYNGHFSKELSLSMLFGTKDVLDSDFKEKLISLNAIHLIVVSGFHISLIEEYFKKIKKYVLKSKITDILFLLFLLLITYLTNFHPSALRVAFSSVGNFYGKYRLKNVDKNNLLGFSAYISMLINPYLVISISFILTYLSTIIIYRYKGNFSGLFIYLINLPIIMHLNLEFNIIGIIIMPLLMLYTELIIPLSILGLFFEFIIPLNDLIAKGFTEIIEFSSSAGSFNILSYRFSSLGILLGYIFFLVQYKNKRYINLIILFAIMISITYISTILNFTTVHILQCGNADSTIIIDKSGNVVVIDFGEDETLAEFLKNNNIRKIKYAFRTHEHEDHAKGMEYFEEYGIKIENYLPETIFNKDIEYTLGGVKIIPLNEITSENNSSKIYKVEIADRTILITGDALLEEVEGLSEGINIYKFPHHGDKKHIDPSLNSSIELVAISTGSNNYGHPSQKTIEFLENKGIRYLRTDIFGTISIRFIKNLILVW
jgi:competence protein ComEC